MKTPSSPRIVVNHDRLEVFVRGRELSLPPTEFKMLVALMGPPAKALTRKELSDASGCQGELSRTVDQHIARLRRKLKGDRDAIKTVSLHGYKFCA